METVNCPICEMSASLETLYPEAGGKVNVYTCAFHGLFSITDEVDRNLREQSSEGDRVLFGHRVLHHTSRYLRAAKDQAYCPHFDSILEK